MSLRLAWLRLSCGPCGHRLALRLSDQFSRHRADYGVFRCPSCNVLASFEEFADASAFTWRRGTLYREIHDALERLVPSRVARDRFAASAPRDRIARCIHELEVLDRYYGRNPPQCLECEVAHERVVGQESYRFEVPCPACAEFPMDYEVVFAGPPASERRYLEGVDCPICDTKLDVSGVIDPQGRRHPTVDCPGCGRTLQGDAAVNRAPPRARVSAFALTIRAAALREVPRNVSAGEPASS